MHRVSLKSSLGLPHPDSSIGIDYMMMAFGLMTELQMFKISGNFSHIHGLLTCFIIRDMMTNQWKGIVVRFIEKVF